MVKILEQLENQKAAMMEFRMQNGNHWARLLAYGGANLRTLLYAAGTLPMTLTVTDTPVPSIAASPSTLTFTAPAFNADPYSQNISVTSPTPVAFSVTLPPNTWVKVSPMSTTPDTLSVTWDPAITSQIYYQQPTTAASIQINVPATTAAVP